MNWWILQGTHGGLNIRDVRFDPLGGKFKRLVEPALAVLAVTPTAIACVWVSNIRKSCQNVLDIPSGKLT